MQDRVIMSDLRAMRRKIGLATEDDGEANLFAVCDGLSIYFCSRIMQRELLKLNNREHFPHIVPHDISNAFSLLYRRWRIG